MSARPTDPFVDATTDLVLGSDEVRALLDIRWSRGRDLVARPSAFLPGERASWEAEIECLRAVETWLDSTDEEALGVAYDQLPEMVRPLTTLEADEPLDEVALFEVKRFLFWSCQITRSIGDALDFVPASWTDDLHAAMAEIHPEKTPSPRFHLSADLDPRLAQARDAIRKLRKRAKQRRDELEKEIIATYGGRFDVRGRYQATAEVDIARLASDERLAPSGPRWDVVDTELRSYEEEALLANEHMWVVEAELMARLSDKMRPRVEWLTEVCDVLAELDVRIAKVDLRRMWDGVWGEWSATGPTELEDGRLPRLLDTLDSDEVQPISIRLDERPSIITGPNMGGKSALIELVGVAQWCAQNAFPIPARAFRFRPVHQIVYVGAEEPHSAGATGLSAFGREVRRLVDAWENRAPRLWLLDELGRGTHPEEGASIAIHVIRSRIRAGDMVVAATHFPAVAGLEEAAHFRIAGLDPKRTLDALTSAPAGLDTIESALREAMDYRALPVQADASSVPRDAWLIARILGLTDEE